MVDKKDLFPEFEEIIGNLSDNQIIHALFDYFDESQLEGLLEHLKEEIDESNLY